MTLRPPEHRIETACDGCGQVDSDPKHLMADLDGHTLNRHFDCCACPVCLGRLADAGGNREVLTAHVTQTFRDLVAAQEG